MVIFVCLELIECMSGFLNTCACVHAIKSKIPSVIRCSLPPSFAHFRISHRHWNESNYTNMHRYVPNGLPNVVFNSSWWCKCCCSKCSLRSSECGESKYASFSSGTSHSVGCGSNICFVEGLRTRSKRTRGNSANRMSVNWMQRTIKLYEMCKCR